MIPGVNDSQEEIEALAGFLKENDGSCKIELLPYHALSADKYRRLGRLSEEWIEPSGDLLNRIELQLEGFGFEVGLRG